jgi:hypothetical protein
MLADGDAAVPVRRWQRVQWQYEAFTSGALTSKRTRPHPQPPVSAEIAWEAMCLSYANAGAASTPSTASAPRSVS